MWKLTGCRYCEQPMVAMVKRSQDVPNLACPDCGGDPKGSLPVFGADVSVLIVGHSWPSGTDAWETAWAGAAMMREELTENLPEGLTPKWEEWFRLAVIQDGTDRVHAWHEKPKPKSSDEATYGPIPTFNIKTLVTGYMIWVAALMPKAPHGVEWWQRDEHATLRQAIEAIDKSNPGPCWILLDDEFYCHKHGREGGE